MGTPTPPFVEVRVRGPLARSDLPGLYARVCAKLTASACAVLLCDLSSVALDAVAIEALVRLQLGARRHGCTVRLRDAPGALIELARFMGLEEHVTA